MKVELLKDLMLPANGTKDKPNVGEPVIASIGDVVEVVKTIGEDWVKRGLAKEASDATPTIVTEEDGEGGEKHVVTTTPKPGADRKTKIQVGPTETKLPDNVVTPETLNAQPE